MLSSFNSFGVIVNDFRNCEEYTFCVKVLYINFIQPKRGQEYKCTLFFEQLNCNSVNKITLNCLEVVGINYRKIMLGTNRSLAIVLKQMGE